MCAAQGQQFARAAGVGTGGALTRGMTMRTFQSRDGATWTIWRVQSTLGLLGTPDEWLAFQNADGTERRRLIEMPPNWEQLADDRLDLLRRMAEPVKSWAPLSPPDGVPVVGEGAGGDGER